MIITAKYAGRCSSCGRVIEVGERIEWQRGSRAVQHTNCRASLASANSQQQQQPSADTVTVTANEIVLIEYKTNVFTQAGWRPVMIEAEATQIRAVPEAFRVIRVLLINDQKPYVWMSRTGAARQSFNGLSIAAREVHKVLNGSSCRVVTEPALVATILPDTPAIRSTEEAIP